MATLITETDIENELQTTLPAGYTPAIISAICDDVHNLLMLKTRRTTFTGVASYAAKTAELYMAIDRLVTSDRDLIKNAIASISENGASIKFSNGKSTDSYRQGALQYIAELKIGNSDSFTVQFPDTQGTHATTDKSILY